MTAETVNAIGADFGKLLRIGYWEALQPDHINQVKDCGVCPDAECEREHRDRCEYGRAPEKSQTVPHVADHVVDDLHILPIATNVFVSLHPAHCAQGGATGIFGSHAVFDVQLDLTLDVVPELFIELAFDEGCPEERAKT